MVLEHLIIPFSASIYAHSLGGKGENTNVLTLIINLLNTKNYEKGNFVDLPATVGSVFPEQ